MPETTSMIAIPPALLARREKAMPSTPPIRQISHSALALGMTIPLMLSPMLFGISPIGGEGGARVDREHEREERRWR
jgi:hypothetical protein